MKKKQAKINLMIAFCLTAAMAVAVSLFSDCWFDLNDDVLMKDIMSGSYTGTPSGHNIQMLYPISLLISLLYRLAGSFDWYGIFLCGCQYGCLMLLLVRLISLSESNKKGSKIITIVIWAILSVSLLMGHLLFVQYTFTCAMLSGTAAFLIMTEPVESRKTGFAEIIRRNLIPCVMLWLAYLIRSEMLLLTLPMVFVAILIRFCLVSVLSSDKQIKHSLACYILITCVIIAGIAAGQFCHRAAYSSSNWKEFVSFFDNRTELYDFSEIPDYEENKDFYDSIGISAAEQNLFVNYNFGLDDEITADTIEKIVDYQKDASGSYESADGNGDAGNDAAFMIKLKKAFRDYFYRLHHTGRPQSFEYPQTDAPWNIIMWLCYLGVFIFVISFLKRNKKQSLLLCALMILLFACRSCLWGYIMLRGRDPVRITHSLYMVEILILFGILLSLKGSYRSENKRNMTIIAYKAMMLIMTVCAAAYIPSSLSICASENAEREEVNEPYDELHCYFRENKDNFYLMDVYSSVSYSEKMFRNVDNSDSNYDIMGGWACKSPLQELKFNRQGISDMQEGLLMDNVYMVENIDDDASWIVEYYASEGIDTRLQLTDTIAGKFGIYKIERKSE